MPDPDLPHSPDHRSPAMAHWVFPSPGARRPGGRLTAGTGKWDERLAQHMPPHQRPPAAEACAAWVPGGGRQCTCHCIKLASLQPERRSVLPSNKAHEGISSQMLKTDGEEQTLSGIYYTELCCSFAYHLPVASHLAENKIQSPHAPDAFPCPLPRALPPRVFLMSFPLSQTQE